MDIVRLDIGSGSHNMRQPLSDWIRIDGCDAEQVDIVCDFGQIPLPENIASEIWVGDVIEHVPMWRWDEVIGEWNRLLKPGGTIAGQTPNLHTIMVRYAKGEMNLEDATNALYGWHDSPWQQHYVTFTASSLTAMLGKYGFTNVTFPETPGADNAHDSWWLCFKAEKL